jgi:circadian clock protein KaiC
MFGPTAVVVDPISAFRGPNPEIHATLVRVADICKTKGITAIFTSLSSVDEGLNESERSVSSLMDVWISLQDKESNGERNRVLYLLKARGMNHSNQLREYRLTSNGIGLIAPYIGQEGVLTGAARLAQEAREREVEVSRHQQTELRKREMARRRSLVERQIEELRAAVDAEEAEIAMLIAQEEVRERSFGADREAMALSRGVRS